MAQISIDVKACTGCGACVAVCAIGQVLELVDGPAAVKHPDACWRCGHCVAVCPEDAIDHEAFPLEDCPLVERNELPDLTALVASLRMRRSHRAFTEKPVDRDEVRELIALGRWAPTASNLQSVDWIALDDAGRIDTLSRETVKEIARFSRWASHPLIRWALPLVVGGEASKQMRRMPQLAERLQQMRDRGEDPIFYHAPLVLIGHCPSKSLLARDDAVYAAYNIMLAAEAHGLGTCQIGFFQLVVERRRNLLRQVGLPPNRLPQIALAVGYPRYPFRRALPRRVPNLIWKAR